VSHEDEVDVIVVGLGAMGSATILRLVERGLRVVGLDRFCPPHDRGSTHGETRITRLAIGEGSEYVPLVRRSHELWRELEHRARRTLLHQIGGLVIGNRDNAFLEQTRAVAAEHKIGHENLSSADLARRFPMFSVSAECEAYLEPEAGFVRPEAAVSAQLTLAQRLGADLRFGEEVTAWASCAAGVEVTTANGRFEAQQLVLSAGAWITKLLPEGSLEIAVYPQLLHWFPIRSGYEALRGMPVFVWETGADRNDFAHAMAFYGFPAIDGPDGGVKLATESYEATVDPDEPATNSVSDAAGRIYEEYLASRFPWVGSKPMRSMRCLYTTTRGSRFVIDRHPRHENVVIVSACSGHGFKHSPAIGEAVAQLVADGASQIDLSSFAMPRAGDD
jgi:sarcosine oxidase